MLADAPEPGKINYELKTALGEERSLHVSRDLLSRAYCLAKTFKAATILISYEKTPAHQDLTWLDAEDPGFLDARGSAPGEQLTTAFSLAFNAGAKKALFLSHLSPVVKEEWLSQAFEAADEKTISLGRNQDGSFYLLAFTRNNLKIINGISPGNPNNAEELLDQAKKAGLAVFTAPETFAVKTEETMRKWLESKKKESPAFAAPAAVEEAGARPAKSHKAPERQ